MQTMQATMMAALQQQIAISIAQALATALAPATVANAGQQVAIAMSAATSALPAPTLPATMVPADGLAGDSSEDERKRSRSRGAEEGEVNESPELKAARTKRQERKARR